MLVPLIRSLDFEFSQREVLNGPLRRRSLATLLDPHRAESRLGSSPTPILAQDIASPANKKIDAIRQCHPAWLPCSL